MNFASDNTAGVAPQILEAIMRANDGFALGYGNDDLTNGIERRIGDLFEREVAVFLVPTGTAANAIALAHITPVWGGVVCHAGAHIVTDECGAPEFFGGGIKLLPVPGDDGKISPAGLRQALARFSGHRPHQVNAASLSLTQATEAGTIYRPQEIAALCEIAHAGGLKVHMDGARFGNALARLNTTPAEMSWRAGVDVLSFGATKGGALAAEAIVFFDPALAAMMPERRKRGGHLLSKHRFLAAQFDGFLSGNCWLTLARHANAMADRLRQRLTAAGVTVVWPVEANLVFAILSAERDARLRGAGAQYYVRPADTLPAGLAKSGELLARFVTSFATREEEIDRLGELMAKPE